MTVIVDRTKQYAQKGRDFSIYWLGWASLVFAALGGAYASGTWIGDTIRWILKITPWDGTIFAALLTIGVVATALDLLADMTPNHPAVIAAICFPSVAAGSNGKLADKIEALGDWLIDKVGGEVATWAGPELTGTALAIICIGVALVLARRVLKKQNAAAGMGRR